ncbi:MAG: primosomal protein N' [Desulfuromonadaceae bacterium]|nr:primosomal protein N' [Desulfuromonadaceae bacterium]MDD2847466.1 primosomal protein N' [Desulfuromonadaceae bacterium]MDD4131421.1 primosomal protein N' [Desulfuromonadaceae bacterium]
MTDKLHIIEVAIPLYLEKTFHYLVPERLQQVAITGRRALVPFGNRKLTGYILGKAAASALTGLKEIVEVLDSEPLWTAVELEFYRWTASYYQHPLGEVIRTALPAGINIQTRKGATGQQEIMTGGKTALREKFYLPAQTEPPHRQPGGKALEILAVIRDAGTISAGELRKRFGTCSPQLKRLVELGLCTAVEREIYRDPFKNITVKRDEPRFLHSHQKAALDAIAVTLDEGLFAPFLLYGVTGSGKTEVYLQAIAHALELGKNALVLVPEIALTPQLTGRFQARFGGGIAILHSGLSDGERYDEWRRIRRGLAQIVIGARSAIFAPLDKIGIIIVDEEHEASFKQSDGLRYNARDLALVRGRMEGAAVVLGSATPSVTTIHAAEQGRLTLLELPERVEGRPMPQVELVAMKGSKETISAALSTSLAETYAQGRQAIVFLNRRGFATFLVCADCAKPLTCPNCSVTLTYHRQRGQSLCHYCDYAVPAPGTCPSCGGTTLSELGAGTEKLEHDLKELLPTARVLRMDSDTTSGKGSHERLLSRMNDGSADILVGTQMIAKGHDFPEVTLVGVVNAEASLGMPDFRAAERTFQLLSQVIGRAGRGEIPGRVVVQALDTEHYAIRAAAEHDATGFYREELEFRREAGYPPFAFLAAFSISGLSEQTVSAQADNTARKLAQLKTELKVRVEILGPAPSPIYRLRNRYRRQILLKGANRADLHRLLSSWRHQATTVSTVRISVDIDPVDMM